MTVEEIKKEKDFLSGDVAELLVRFYKRTGVSVKSMEVLVADCRTVSGEGPGYAVCKVISELDI